MPLVKWQTSFHEIHSLAMCRDIKTFNRVNRTAEHSENTIGISGILYSRLLKMIQPYKFLSKLLSEA